MTGYRINNNFFKAALLKNCDRIIEKVKKKLTEPLNGARLIEEIRRLTDRDGFYFYKKGWEFLDEADLYDSNILSSEDELYIVDTLDYHC